MLGLFISDLHKAVSTDELRVGITQVFFDKGNAYATNAHIAVRQSLSYMNFNDEEIAILNGKGLTAGGFALARKARALEVTEDCLVAIIGKTRVEIDWAEDVKRADVDHVINAAINAEKPSSDGMVFSMNSKRIVRLMSAMSIESHPIFDVSDPHRAIIVYDDAIGINDQCAIIMPVMISKNI